MKRVLIIAYYWPPAGGPGVQRWLKFVKYFRDFGIEPVLYVPENPHYPIQDASFEKEIPSNLEILKQPINEPYKYAKLLFKKKTQKISSGIIDAKDPSFVEKLMLYARGNWFIPDARVGWVKPSVAFLTDYLEKNNDIDTVITTGPPHSLHLIGKKLKVKAGVKWIADFRDPWTSIHYHKSLKLSKRAQRKHKKLEYEVLSQADRVVATSPSTQAEFEKISGRSVALITNGFDTSDKVAVSMDSNFSLVHVGSLLSNRNPAILWETLGELSKANPQFQNDLKIQLVGLVAREVKDSIAAQGLEASLEVPGYVSHEEALKAQQGAQLLVLIEMNRTETRAILPGKLFEYLRSRRPIVALGPKGSDMAQIIGQADAGRFFDYEEKLPLKEYIELQYKRFKQDGIPNCQGSVEAFSRKELTKSMVALINSL